VSVVSAVSESSLRLADHLFRGVLLDVVSRCVGSISLKYEGATTLVGPYATGRIKIVPRAVQ
jgi:hypothetical protein